VTPFLDSESNELYPEFSPDGHWFEEIKRLVPTGKK